MRIPIPLITVVLPLLTLGCTPKKETPKPNVSAEAAAAHSAAMEGSAAALAPDQATPVVKSDTGASALPVIGPAAPWKLKDVNGNVVSSDQFKGKIVVLDFWATWCPPCREEIPGYVDLYRKYGKDGLVIVGVSMDEAGPKVVADFVKKYGVTYPIVMADDSVVSAYGGMEAIPTTFLIDRTGQIRDKKVGAEPTEVYEKKITALLK
jgi:peroxiredoxin